MIRGALYGLTAAAIWGGMFVVSDVVLRTIPPFTLLTVRLILGALVLAIVVVSRGQGARLPAPRQMIVPLAVGMVGFGLSLGAQFVGTDLSTAVNGALVTSASPAFIVIFAALILRERLSLRGILAVALATGGVLVIIDPSRADFSSQTFLGDMSLALAALTWGLYSVLVRRVSTAGSPADEPPPLDTLAFTLLAFIGGLILIIPASLIELSSRPIGPLDGGIVLGVLYLGIVSTAVAMWLWNRAFALVSASVAALFFFAQPVVGAGLGVLILGQPMTPGLWIGAALIAAGVLLAAFSPA